LPAIDPLKKAHPKQRDSPHSDLSVSPSSAITWRRFSPTHARVMIAACHAMSSRLFVRISNAASFRMGFSGFIAINAAGICLWHSRAKGAAYARAARPAACAISPRNSATLPGINVQAGAGSPGRPCLRLPASLLCRRVASAESSSAESTFYWKESSRG
jgi:hypothetical protein